LQFDQSAARWDALECLLRHSETYVCVSSKLFNGLIMSAACEFRASADNAFRPAQKAEMAQDQVCM